MDLRVWEPLFLPLAARTGLGPSPTLSPVAEDRTRIYPFVLSLAALAALTYAFVQDRNGAAVIMCATCIGGLVAARAMGFSNRALVPLALGLALVLTVVWGEVLPVTPDENSAIAHAAGGLLAGWAISEYLRDRFVWVLWPLAALVAVFLLSVLWEVSEYIGDRAFETALIPNREDSITDVAFGTLGGAMGMLFSLLIPSSSHRE